MDYDTSNEKLMNSPQIRTVEVVRYVKPLREGGSLPAIVEADDGFLYVIKFRGAGQGKKALIAELIGGELARIMGLKVPEIVFMELDASFSRTEPDEEIQDLLRFSVGLNLGLHYLSGSITFDPLVSVADPETASKVVLLDSLITNVDRTYKNPNLLNWHRELWLIDHGARLYFHHAWDNWKEHSRRGFPAIKDHVLLKRAQHLPQACQEIKSRLNTEIIEAIIGVIPEDWLTEENDVSVQEKRKVYVEYLGARLASIDQLAKEAEDARKTNL